MSAHSTAPAPAHRDAILPPPSGWRPVIDVGEMMAENERLRARVEELEAEVASLRGDRATEPGGFGT